VAQAGEFKGAVLFDGVESPSVEYLAALRDRINEINKRDGVGMPITGPILQEVLEMPN